MALQWVGVDRVSVSWAATGGADAGKWQNVAYHTGVGDSPSLTKMSSTVKAGGASVMVGTMRMLGRGLWGKVEFNPSRILDPDGCSLADLDDLPMCLEAAFGVVGDLVAVPEDFDALRVKRVDLAVDFETEGAAPLLRSLGVLPRKWARMNATHQDPARSGAQTLTVGSGAGLVRAYDKAEETKGLAADGTVRVEAECRAGWLEKYGGVKVLEDLTRFTSEHLFRDRWEWSRMGAEVVGDLAGVVSRVGRAGLTPAVERAFLGYLIQQASGFSPVLPKATAAKYRRIQAGLGLAVDHRLFEQGSVVSRRLDLDTRREVLRVA